MNLEELTGLAYQPWNGAWSFTTDTSVNYLLWATKPLAQ
jgi:2-polyprenyl-3-methyl-5-hydroxy-6-metoxy-1,4-benzoquinol methylase